MDKIIITDAIATKRYIFKGTELDVEGECDYIPQTKEVVRIRGSFYTKEEEKAYIGNFDGEWDGGKLNYSIHSMTAENAEKVVGVIEDVDEYVQQIADMDEPEIPEPTPEELLARAKSAKIEEIDTYNTSSDVNSFSIGEQVMWLTVQERQQIATQISAHEAAGREAMTRWFNGQEFTFPIVTWKQMLAALEVYAGDALNVTEAHKAAVMALTTIADVEAFDITTGYPPKLEFNV